MVAPDRHRGQLRRATYRTLIGLLAVTGTRVREAIRLDRADLELAVGVVTVRDSEFGKTRELPLHPTTVTRVRQYLRTRDAHQHAAVSDALLISPVGTQLIYCNVHATVRQLGADAGPTARSSACRPRIHDLRHRFACRRCWTGTEQGTRCNSVCHCCARIRATQIGGTHFRICTPRRS